MNNVNLYRYAYFFKHINMQSGQKQNKELGDKTTWATLLGSLFFNKVQKETNKIKINNKMLAWVGRYNYLKTTSYNM